MIQPILLTDLDNTLYNWKDYFAKSFRGMVHALSEKTKVEEDIIINEFRTVYSAHKSLEYSFALQEFEIFRSLPKKELQELINLAITVFNQVGMRNLKPYDGVKETLSWAKNVGITVVGVTNAPLAHAHKRIKRLGLSKYFSGLAGRKDPSIPQDMQITRKIKKGVDDGNYSSKIKKFWELEPNQLKPNSFVFREIMDHYHIGSNLLFVVGDSLHSDIKPALDIGAVGIWARYGKDCDESSNETLSKITPWDANMIADIEFSAPVVPTFTIDQFIEIERIIPPPQETLPGF